MSQNDDRAEFEQMKHRQALALGQDKALFRQAIELHEELDRHDYSYLWSWMGVPIIQMPADIMATQEVIWNTKPNLTKEIGVERLCVVHGLAPRIDGRWQAAT